MRGRRLAVVLVALGSLALLAAAGAVAILRDDEARPAATAAETQPGGLERCAELFGDRVQDCYSREFERMVGPSENPGEVLEGITKIAYETGPPLLSDCHGLMHTVGRHYVARHDVTVATLMDYLPRSNDPGCSAGFAHGLVTGVAPQIDPRRPRAAAAVCGEAGTRFQRYSCTHGFGHAFMRIYDDRLPPALALCSALGRRAAPDCAQGAYHDYWFGVIGADEAKRAPGALTSPYELCAGQRDEFVRPCWYRAFVDTRPPGFQTASPADLIRLCGGLDGVQRAACITAASVIGPTDPAQQLQLCAAGLDPVDAVSCIHGTKVQNILNRPTATYVTLIGGCDAFAGPTRVACYRWLGKVLAVITDGAFEREGCPQVPAPALRRACVAGARSMDNALETFS